MLQLLVTLLGSLAPITSGMMFGYHVTALLSMASSDPHLISDTHAITWLVSAGVLTGILGMLSSGPIVDWLGRRRTAVCAGPLVALCWIAVGLSNTTTLVIFFKALMGLFQANAMGAVSLLVVESTDHRKRGKYESYLRFAMVAGNLLVFCFGVVLGWRGQAFTCSLIPMGLVGLSFLPESPAWLRSKGRTEEADKAAARLGLELNQATDPLQTETSEDTPMLSRPVLIPVALSFVVWSLVHLGGTSPVVSNAGLMFREFMDKPSLAIVVVGVAEMVCIVISSFLVDTVGRKVTLEISLVVMASSTLGLGLYFHLQLHSPVLLVLLVLGLGGGQALGCFTVPVIIILEFAPQRHRSLLSSWVICAGFLVMFAVLKSHNHLLEWLGKPVPYWIYTACSLFNCFFIWRFIPETKGMTLTEIEVLFKSKYKK